MKSALTSCFSLLTFLVVTPAWANSVNLDSEQNPSSVFSEDAPQFLIDSDLHFSGNPTSVQFNPVTVDQIAIAASSPSPQPTAQNAEDFKLSQLNLTLLNSNTNAADLQLNQQRKEDENLSDTSLSNLEKDPINFDQIISQALAEESPSSTPTTEQPQSRNGWRFEIEPMLFVPFNIDGYAIVGEGASVNRVVLVDLITAEITNRILNKVPPDLIEKAVDRVLERLPLDRRNTRLEDRIAQEVRERLQQRGQDLTERLETQIREGVQTIVDRVPPGQVPVEVDFNIGLGDILDFNKILELGTRVEAWNGDIGLIFQGTYAEMGITENGSQIDIDFDNQLLTAELSLAWHLGTLPLTQVKDGSQQNSVYPSLDFEVYGGARFGYLQSDFNFDPGPDINYRPDWFDPSVGAQIKLNLADNLAITTRGGTAITGGSEAPVNWDLLVALNWQVSRDLNLSAGYRLY